MVRKIGKHTVVTCHRSYVSLSEVLPGEYNKTINYHQKENRYKGDNRPQENELQAVAERILCVVYEDGHEKKRSVEVLANAFSLLLPSALLFAVARLLYLHILLWAEYLSEIIAFSSRSPVRRSTNAMGITRFYC